MTHTHAPYRVDHVGSFLRPAALVQAREDFAAGKISQADLTKVEDQAIRDLVEKEIAAGLQSVTDGEFRRAYWHLDFFWGFGGIDHVQAAQGYQSPRRNPNANKHGEILHLLLTSDQQQFPF